MPSAVSAALRGGAVFAAAAALGVLFTGGLWSLFGDTISAARESYVLLLARETLADAGYENAHFDFAARGADLPAARVLAAACARKKNGKPAAVVARAIAKNGYGGEMEFIAAFAEGGAFGARVVRHRETPGIADFLQKPGGAKKALDGVSGATITSDALARAVGDLEKWSAETRADICAQKNNKTENAENMENKL